MHTLTFMVYLIYGICFWIVYLIIFIQMIRPMYQKYFSYSFFTLAKILAVVDLCGHIVFTCLTKIPMSNLFGPLFASVTPNYGWSVLYFIGYIGEFIRAMLILATTFNRLTSLLWPHSHENRWKIAMPGVIAICFMVPFCLSFQRLFAPTGVIPTDPVNQLFVFSTNLLDWYPNELNALTMAAFYAVVGTTTVIVNLSSLLTLYLYKRETKLHLHHRKSIRKTEIGLVLVSFGDAVGMLLMTVVQLVLYWLGRQNRYTDPLYGFMFQQLFWIIDLGRFTRPLLLLLICKQVRVVFFRTFRMRSSKSFNITVISNSNRSPIQRMVSHNITIKSS